MAEKIRQGVEVRGCLPLLLTLWLLLGATSGIVALVWLIAGGAR